MADLVIPSVVRAVVFDVGETLVDETRTWSVLADRVGVTRLTLLRPEQVAYVGDRLDNDVFPAKAAGMFAVFIRRGPWGYLHARGGEAACADARIDSLAELTMDPRQEDRQP